MACLAHLGRSRSEIKKGLPGERLKGVALDVGQAELDVERAVLQLAEHVVRRHELVALHAERLRRHAEEARHAERIELAAAAATKELLYFDFNVWLGVIAVKALLLDIGNKKGSCIVDE